MKLILWVEWNGRWASLWSRPEWVSIAVLVVVWQESFKISDVEIIESLKFLSGFLDTESHAGVVLQVDKLLDVLELLNDT